MNILEEIIANKKFEVEKSKDQFPLDRLKKSIVRRDGVYPVSFSQKLKDKINKKEIGLIAEIKKASPSKGIIKSDFNPVEIAKAYKAGGASCLSVLTDEKYFQGDLSYIKEIKSVEALHEMPLLRKDFIIDPYQIYESAYYKADCILLIVAALEKDMLKRLFELSAESKLDVLVEVRNEKEIEIALNLNPKMVGINNRDLKTFKTDLDTTINLATRFKQDLKDKVIVSESGIFTNKDIQSLIKNDVYTFLVGESLIINNDIASATKKLIGLL